MTAASVGAHGSAGGSAPLGAGLAGAEPDGLLGGEVLNGDPGEVSSGRAARAVSEGWTVKVDASLEKSAQPAVSVSKSPHSIAGARRRNARGRRARGIRSAGAGEEYIAVQGTAKPVSPAYGANGTAAGWLALS